MLSGNSSVIWQALESKAAPFTGKPNRAQGEDIIVELKNICLKKSPGKAFRCVTNCSRHGPGTQLKV